MDAREVNLPKWARELIADLRTRIHSATEPHLKELNRIRPQNETLRAQNSTLMELLHCAANGGHMTAKDIIAVLDGYEMCLVEHTELDALVISALRREEAEKVASEEDHPPAPAHLSNALRKATAWTVNIRVYVDEFGEHWGWLAINGKPTLGIPNASRQWFATREEAEKVASELRKHWDAAEVSNDPYWPTDPIARHKQ